MNIFTNPEMMEKLIESVLNANDDLADFYDSKENVFNRLDTMNRLEAKLDQTQGDFGRYMLARFFDTLAPNTEYGKKLTQRGLLNLFKVQNQGYAISSTSGLVMSPGKFESEPFGAIILWQYALEGFSDYDNGHSFEFTLPKANLMDYGIVWDNAPDECFVVLYESDNRFVYTDLNEYSISDSDNDINPFVDDCGFDYENFDGDI